MTWKRLLRQGRVARHATSPAELQSLRRLAARGLRDATVAGLSPDGRFLLAYGAALALARMAIAKAGWRVKRRGGAHATTFEALVVAVGPMVVGEAAYFETCRQRRNMLSYDAESVLTEEDAQEPVRRVRSFETRIVTWCAQRG